MSINPDRNYGQMLTAATARRSKRIQDIVYKATPLTRILLGEGVGRSGSRIQVKRAGGPELRIPIEFDKLQAQWFTGYDYIQITPKELLNSAVFNWSRVVAPFSLNGTELLFNGGEEEVIDLIAFYLNSAEKSVKEEFEASLISDGTGSGGRQIIGLNGAIPAIPNAGIYGGISRVDVANWRTSFFDIANGDVPGVTAWDSTTARIVIEHIALARSRGGRYPDLWIMDPLSYRAISQAVMAISRAPADYGPGTWGRSSRLARLGFEGISLLTSAGVVDIVAAGGIGSVMPANTIFGIDTEGLALYEFPGQSFVPFHPGNGLRPINQDAIAQGIVWSGGLVLENPLFSVRVDTSA